MVEEKENKEMLQARTSPHFRSPLSVEKIMWVVVIALLPAAIGGIYYFGINALLVILTTVITSILTEFIIKKWVRKGKFVMDGSAVLTGLLLGLVLPPLEPQYLWMAALGSVIAIGIAKEAFGGLGHNIFNPALVGRTFMTASFAGVLGTAWMEARGNTVDAFTGATPLAGAFDHMATSMEYKSLFLGNVGGCIGETSALLLMAGGLLLILLRIIDWRIPLFYIGVVFSLS